MAYFIQTIAVRINVWMLLFLGKEKNVSHRKRCANRTFFCLHTRITGTTYTNYRDHIQFFVGPGKSTSDLPGPHTQVSILPTYRDHVEIIANTFECCFLCLFEVKSTFTMKTNEKIWLYLKISSVPVCRQNYMVPLSRQVFLCMYVCMYVCMYAYFGEI